MTLDDFDIIVRLQRGTSLAYIPELGLFARGANTQAAIDELTRKKTKLQRELEEAGVDDLSIFKFQPRAPDDTYRELRKFSIKAVIVVVLLFIAGGLAANRADSLVTRIRAQIEEAKLTLQEAKASMSGRRFWTEVEARLDKLASPEADLTPEKKKEILAKIQIIADRWRPFAAEGLSVFSPKAGPSPLPQTAPAK